MAMRVPDRLIVLEGATSDESDFKAKNYLLGSAKCYLCDHTFVVGDEPFMMFERRLREDGQYECALSSVLALALGQDVDEADAHSTLLCENCNTVVLEFESLEQRFSELRYRILSAYNDTAQRNNLKSVMFEVNGVLHDTNDILLNIKAENEELPANKPAALDNITEEVAEYTNDFVGDVNADALVEEVHDDDEDDEMSNEVILGTEGYDFIVTDNEQQLLKTEAPDATITNDENIDEEDLLAYNDIIEHTTQLSGDINEEDDEFSADSSQIEEEDAAMPISQNSVQVDNDNEEAAESKQQLFKLQGNRYCCLICKTAPPHLDGKSFAEHMRSAHNTPFFVCDLCHMGFAERKDLNVHVEAQHCVLSKYECETCKRVFMNYRLFRLHKRSHYGNTKQYECNVCQKKYTSKNLLAEHMNMHTGDRPFKCDKCPKEFASKYTLQAHTKIHTERQRPYKCDECGRAFLNQQNLSQHKKLHVSVKTFVCDSCPKAFTTQHNLDVHKIVHSGQRPFLCRTCGKAFARRADVKDHERTHTGERPFHCDLCPLAFAQRSNLTSHKKSTHLNEKLHRCDKCDRSFKRRRLLDYHIQAAHTGERPYKCEVCSAAFVYPEHYKKHMVIHSGQKPYKCEICGKQFNSSDNRKAHRYVHSDKKLYECLKCGAGFMRKPFLLSHMAQMGHGSDTIVINQPQIREPVMIALTDDIDDSEFGETNENVEETAQGGDSLENMLARVASEADVDAVGVGVGDAIAVSGQLIKDELGAVKYLEFADLDGDEQGAFTWVDIGAEGDKV